MQQGELKRLESLCHNCLSGFKFSLIPAYNLKKSVSVKSSFKQRHFESKIIYCQKIFKRKKIYLINEKTYFKCKKNLI